MYGTPIVITTTRVGSVTYITAERRGRGQDRFLLLTSYIQLIYLIEVFAPTAELTLTCRTVAAGQRTLSICLASHLE